MKHQVHNLIILDESGSMESIKRATIQSFNEIIQTARAMETEFPDQEHRISFVTFNGARRKTHLWNQPVKAVKPIDARTYRPDASTPLYDTIGFAASRLSTELSDLPAHNVLVTIFTDGEENASREWSGVQIKALVEKLKQQRWTFTYIGTDHDVSSAAMKISITNTVTFDKSNSGVLFHLSEEKSARRRYSEKIQNNLDTEGDFYTDTKRSSL